MIHKGQKLYSILFKKCPRCHEGDFYKNPLSFRLLSLTKLNENCSSCGQKFELEPSFYYGAMYVSYALTVALAVAVFLICYLIGISLINTFIAIVIALILGTPIVSRLSRIIYINLFVSYQDKNDRKIDQ
ncbi:MAG: DUF983 domain-containing protein [Flavobacteriaceae bacterium]